MAGGGGKRHCALTETQMARLIGGGGRGGYGGVVGEMAVALLRWFASSATAKLRGNNGGAAELVCSALWGDEMKN